MDEASDAPRAAGVAVVVTCEHGGNEVPPELAHLFASETGRLTGHRGSDAGALEMARAFAAAFAAPLFFSTVTRLVVDGNRSVGHPKLFSRTTKTLSRDLRRDILQRYHQPLRRQAMAAVSAARAAGLPVVHLSAHSFAPVFRGRERTMDVGLLYDPGRTGRGTCVWPGAGNRGGPGRICGCGETRPTGVFPTGTSPRCANASRKDTWASNSR
jgi:predicted N-formylglutamate amidohydrolase